MRDGSRAWAGLAALLCVLALAASLLPPQRIDWQPALALREPWRALSAAALHYSPMHLGANLLGALLVGAFGLAARVPPAQAVAWLVAWPITHAALLMQPALLHFGGLSGVLHAGVAVAATHLLLADRGPRRAIGLAVLLGLAVKILRETPWGAPVRQLAGWDIGVAPLAHATGALAGLFCASIAHLVTLIRSAPRA